MGERLKNTSKPPLPHTTTGHPMDPNQFNIVHKEVNSHSRRPCSSVCRPHSQQTPWQVPAAGHMGPPPPGITHPPVKAHQPSNHLISYITPPYWFPPPSFLFTILSHCPLWQGAHTFFFPMVSTHICPKYSLSLSTTSPTAAPSW